MGCTQSKSRRDGESDEAIKQDTSPIRDETRRQPEQGPTTVVASSNDVPQPFGRKFVQGGPNVVGGLVTPCFKSGVLFKVCKEDRMYFYNDSAEHEAHVTFDCGPQSNFVCGPSVSSEKADTWCKLRVVVFPGETELFVTGTLNGYRSEYVMKPLSTEYIARIQREAESTVQAELRAVQELGLDNVDDVVDECLRRNIHFVDLDFPPAQGSLSRKHDARRLHPLVWKRPRTFLSDGRSGTLFTDGVHPDDIDQGQLGDCWFLCAVASVAEFPAKIKDMFSHPNGEHKAGAEQSLGLYRVTLNKHGWWTCVIVDDYLPCIANKPCFAKNDCDPAELWVSLLEKAYAKLNGSYSAITGGDALHAMSDLTGYPTTRFDTEWDDARKDDGARDALFGDLVRYDSEGYLINFNTPGVDASAYMAPNSANQADLEAKYTAAGLGLGHAYSVLVVKDVVDSDGVRVKLLKIRNPWGSGAEWTGRWSDNSDLWTKNPLVAKECDYQQADDGTFWMEWSDALEFFDGGGVCFTKFGWHDYRIGGCFHQGVPDIVLELFAHEDFDAFVVLSQPDRRGQMEGTNEAKYSPLMLSVCKADTDNHTRQVVDVNSSSDADKPTKPFTYIIARDVGVKYHFARRDDPYIIIPRIHDKIDKHFVIGMISSVQAGTAMSVNFKRLYDGSPGLKHCKAFPYIAEDVPFAEPRKFQYNPEVGCALNLNGTGLHAQNAQI